MILILIPILIICVFLSGALGSWAKIKGYKFAVYFIISFLLTPLIGLIIVANLRNKNIVLPEVDNSPQFRKNSADQYSENKEIQLRELKNFKDKGFIDENEYQQRRQHILHKT